GMNAFWGLRENRSPDSTRPGDRPWLRGPARLAGDRDGVRSAARRAGSPASPPGPLFVRRACAAVGRRRGAADRAGARGLVHVQGHVPFELQFAFYHRIRTEDEPRLALGDLDRDLVRARLGDGDAAGHVRSDAGGDVAADRRDAAGEVHVDDPDRTVDGLDVATDA